MKKVKTQYNLYNLFRDITIAAVLILLIVGHTRSYAHLQNIQDYLQKHYTPEGRTGGFRILTGDEPFTGDCKDYYMAAMNQLIQSGYTPVAAIGATRGHEEKVFHIMACAYENGNLWCLDNTSKTIISESTAHRLYQGLKFRQYDG